MADDDPKQNIRKKRNRETAPIRALIFVRKAVCKAIFKNGKIFQIIYLLNLIFLYFIFKFIIKFYFDLSGVE